MQCKLQIGNIRKTITGEVMLDKHKPESIAARFKLPSGLSMYLDLLRFLAAFGVFISHAGHFSQFRIPLVGDFGSHGVVVFFVLSGLVIAYSADTKHIDLTDFVLARLARLWSVVLPALALTFILDTIGQYIALSSYSPMQPYTAFKWVASFIANAFFLNQIWNLSVWPGTNGPFWSLSYEFWYYAIFAAAFYFKGPKRTGIVAVAMLIAGPGILTALPVWAMGVALYLLLKTAGAPARWHGLLIWCLSFIVAVSYALVGGHDFFAQIVQVTSNLMLKEWSINFWPESYSIGAIVSLNIYGFAGIGAYLCKGLSKYAALIRSVADTSFGLYLFHYPIMYFVRAVLVFNQISDEWAFAVVIYIIPFVTSILLAWECETYKHSLAKFLMTLATSFGYNRSAPCATDIELETNLKTSEASTRLSP